MENIEKQRLKTITIVLSVLAVVLLGVLVWLWINRSKMIDDLKVDKEDLTTRLHELRLDYSTISSNNDSLNVQLERERERVDQLIERVKQTEAANRTKIRQYEQELGTLRSIMRNYITQIDSLNTINTSLRQDVMVAREEVRKTQRDYSELKSTADENARKVEVGSVVKGRNFKLVALTAAGKENDRSSRMEKIQCCFYLMENEIATKGPRYIYLRVKDPDGVLMTTGNESHFTSAGELLIYSASREVDYQGFDVEVCIYFGEAGMFKKGVYVADVYTTQSKLGTVEVVLK